MELKYEIAVHSVSEFVGEKHRTASKIQFPNISCWPIGSWTIHGSHQKFSPLNVTISCPAMQIIAIHMTVVVDAVVHLFKMMAMALARRGNANCVPLFVQLWTQFRHELSPKTNSLCYMMLCAFVCTVHSGMFLTGWRTLFIICNLVFLFLLLVCIWMAHTNCSRPMNENSHQSAELHIHTPMCDD